MIDSMDLRSEQALRFDPPLNAAEETTWGLSARRYALDFLAGRVRDEALLRQHAVRLRDFFEVGSEEYRALLLLKSYGEGTTQEFRNPRAIAEGILFATRSLR